MGVGTSIFQKISVSRFVSISGSKASRGLDSHFYMKNKIQQLYITEHRPVSEICNILQIGRTKFYKLLKKYNIVHRGFKKDIELDNYLTPTTKLGEQIIQLRKSGKTYLEICKQYNAKAVIELKYSPGINNNDQSRMQALMDEIERCGMRKEVIFLGSAYNCLIWTRNNGYEDVPCQYLVNSCESEEVLKRCIDNKLDLSFNSTGDYSNSTEWIAKYKEAGCKVSCYTFTQYSNYKTLQEWINKGVDYVTCDWQLMSKVDLPKKEK